MIVLIVFFSLYTGIIILNDIQIDYMNLIYFNLITLFISILVIETFKKKVF